MVVEENPELIVCIINKNEYCIIKDKRPETSGPWRLGTKTRFLQLYISFFIKEVFLIFFIGGNNGAFFYSSLKGQIYTL